MITVSGADEGVHLHRRALPASVRVSRPGRDKTTADEIEACEAAWEFYGGVFRVLIPDNTKPIVDPADSLQPRHVNSTSTQRVRRAQDQEG